MTDDDEVPFDYAKSEGSFSLINVFIQGLDVPDDRKSNFSGRLYTISLENIK